MTYETQFRPIGIWNSHYQYINHSHYDDRTVATCSPNVNEISQICNSGYACTAMPATSSQSFKSWIANSNVGTSSNAPINLLQSPIADTKSSFSHISLSPRTLSTSNDQHLSQSRDNGRVTLRPSCNAPAAGNTQIQQNQTCLRTHAWPHSNPLTLSSRFFSESKNRPCQPSINEMSINVPQKKQYEASPQLTHNALVTSVINLPFNMTQTPSTAGAVFISSEGAESLRERWTKDQALHATDKKRKNLQHHSVPKAHDIDHSSTTLAPTDSKFPEATSQAKRSSTQPMTEIPVETTKSVLTVQAVSGMQADGEASRVISKTLKRRGSYNRMKATRHSRNVMRKISPEEQNSTSLSREKTLSPSKTANEGCKVKATRNSLGQLEGTTTREHDHKVVDMQALQARCIKEVTSEAQRIKKQATKLTRRNRLDTNASSTSSANKTLVAKIEESRCEKHDQSASDLLRYGLPQQLKDEAQECKPKFYPGAPRPKSNKKVPDNVVTSANFRRNRSEEFQQQVPSSAKNLRITASSTDSTLCPEGVVHSLTPIKTSKVGRPICRSSGAASSQQESPCEVKKLPPSTELSSKNARMTITRSQALKKGIEEPFSPCVVTAKASHRGFLKLSGRRLKICRRTLNCNEAKSRPLSRTERTKLYYRRAKTKAHKSGFWIDDTLAKALIDALNRLNRKLAEVGTKDKKKKREKRTFQFPCHPRCQPSQAIGIVNNSLSMHEIKLYILRAMTALQKGPSSNDAFPFRLTLTRILTSRPMVRLF